MKRKFEKSNDFSQYDSTIQKIQKAEEPTGTQQEITQFWNEADMKIKQSLIQDYSAPHNDT